MILSVYLGCAATSLWCAILLLRASRRERKGLLLWTGLCFAFLFLGNVMVVVDLSIVPERDLALTRVIPGLVGIGFLLYGLVWESAE